MAKVSSLQLMQSRIVDYSCADKYDSNFDLDSDSYDKSSDEDEEITENDAYEDDSLDDDDDDDDDSLSDHLSMSLRLDFKECEFSTPSVRLWLSRTLLSISTVQENIYINRQPLGF
jgi:hypothetical protein